MRYIKPKNWTNIQSQEGLLFFAQVLDEALFSYTLDTYKPQALNIRLLCIEAIQTIEHIKNGLIKFPNLNSIVEELLWALSNDFIAKGLINTMHTGIIKNINANKESLSKINFLKDNILLLYHFLDNKKYLDVLKKQLTQFVSNGTEKKKIYYATRSYITELINYGYTPGYIYHMVHKIFYDFSKNSKKIEESDPNIFFQQFLFTEKRYTVIYRANKVFTEFKNIELRLNFRIENKFDHSLFKIHEKSFVEKKDLDEVFIIFENINALDDNRVRIKTEKPLQAVRNLFSFYHHKERPKIDDRAIVINETDQYAITRDRPIKSIIKKEDIKPLIAVKKVEKLFAELDLEKKTLERLTRAIDLHSIALETEQIENKLLNLWTALEMLIPKDPESGEDRIVQMVKAIIPFQCKYYLTHILREAGNDFVNFNKKTAPALLDTVIVNGPETKFTRLAALIMTDENEDIRKNVYSMLGEYPLLRWRLFDLNKKFSTGQGLKKFIENHRQRVEWQIRRIYRVRNLIVHSGKMPSYTNILVENLHNYFDNFLNEIIESAIDRKRIRTISQAVLTCQIEYDVLINTLDGIGNDKLTLNNFKSVIIVPHKVISAPII